MLFDSNYKVINLFIFDLISQRIKAFEIELSLIQPIVLEMYGTLNADDMDFVQNPCSLYVIKWPTCRSYVCYEIDCRNSFIHVLCQIELIFEFPPTLLKKRFIVNWSAI